MEKKEAIKATDAELEILNLLWANGPSTVREVHDRLAEKKDAGYTTTLKQMQVMTEKGLLSREAQGKSHVYTAVPDRKETQDQIMRRVIDTVFEGSAMQMVMQALGNHKPSKDELAMITDYLEQRTKK